MFCLSFVVVTVKARLAGLDPRLEQAAMDLYANEWQTFRRVTLPAGLPGHRRGGAAVASRCPSTTSSSPTSTPARRSPSRCSSGAPPARHPAADQRDRHGDVPRRAARRRARRAGEPAARRALITPSGAMARDGVSGRERAFGRADGADRAPCVPLDHADRALSQRSRTASGCGTSVGRHQAGELVNIAVAEASVRTRVRVECCEQPIPPVGALRS